MLVALAVAGVGGFATLMTLLLQGGSPSPQEMLRIGRTELNSGRVDVARQLALAAEIDAKESPALEAQRQWILGMVDAARAAEESKPQRRKLVFSSAANHLAQASRLGLPAGQAASGNAALGHAYLEIGRYRDAAEKLKRSLDQDPTSARRLLTKLAESRLRAGEPSKGIIEPLDKYLRFGQLTSQARAEALMIRAEAWRGAGDRARSDADLAEASLVEGFAERAILLSARMDIEEVRQFRQANGGTDSPAIAKQLQMTVESLTELVRTITPENGASARYLLGEGLRLIGNDKQALSALASVRQSRRWSPEAIAAAVAELELHGDQSRIPEALDTAAYLVREIGDPQTFDARWMTLEQFQRRLTAVVEQLHQNGQYDGAIRLTKALPPLLSSAALLRLQGNAYRSWAIASAESDQRLVAAGSLPEASKTRERFAVAAATLEAASKEAFATPEYVSMVWEACEAYQQARLYRQSIRMLDEYLRYEQRSRWPRALVSKGVALLSLGQLDEALVPLREVITLFDGEPLRYEARLVAARAYNEKGLLDQAITLLEDNLFDEGLTPISPTWRETLKMLGSTLFDKSFREQLVLDAILNDINRPADTDQRLANNHDTLIRCVDRLEEFVQRFADDRDALHASYLAARAHRLAAIWPERAARMPETLDGARREYNQIRGSHLQTAFETFQKLRVSLNDLQEKAPLTTFESAMVRNCYLSEADALLAMERYQEAADAYRAATHRFLGEPQALEAMVQEAQCYRALSRNDEAQRVVRQAQQILDRIPAERDPDFTKTTRYDRAGWRRLLEWLAQT
jgi:tetratricopeptide (TPR) repeat protein